MTAPLENTATLFDTLSDPDRLSVYLLMMHCCRGAPISMTPDQAAAWVEDAALSSGLPVSTITGHLAALESAGLVHISREADTVACRFGHRRFEAIAAVFGAARPKRQALQSTQCRKKGELHGKRR
jgi:DNA-binding transcriptional ArsR family regulator